MYECAYKLAIFKKIFLVLRAKLTLFHVLNLMCSVKTTKCRRRVHRGTIVRIYSCNNLHMKTYLSDYTREVMLPAYCTFRKNESTRYDI